MSNLKLKELPDPLAVDKLPGDKPILHASKTNAPASKIEALIGNLQKDFANNQILKTSYLKRSIATRASQRYISSLQHPITGQLCTSSVDLQDAAKTFYQQLYQSDPTSDANVSILLDTIPDSDIIPSDSIPPLLAPFTIHDLVSASSRSPRKSSPGIDGIPYEILSLVFKHPGVAPLAVKVYNEALLQSVFPSSWLCTSTALLPKKVILLC
ncbi:hypothetical protein G6F57_016709 [Rhizopus arrhizus]|uniref:Reverse transcriptase domain-containing protein n=1 Tax=Rhizopus oryzae TaxID=64495 RepID=A0A9P6WWE5_RHIOR|nr:hypothetical protein G6F23_012721 [Rhizopus arrhizus]KAG0752017.1 hypothetical protein G6F24_013858 [Rhizopus arrhizus]KAG0777910.1 hypothetical protein G6F21_013190 [Rhizopus arrhizus]KAG0803800.1 hypothetical protein G6F20_013205 [Rhizopus arrhizus]KAG0885189.1 hypothetical protein G6F34_013259 [Rhizopus arrhizus]